MHLIFSHHFQFRLHERKLNIEDIKHAILMPDFENKGHQGRVVVRKEIEGRILEVIYFKKKHKSNEYVIITAYYIN